MDPLEDGEVLRREYYNQSNPEWNIYRIWNKVVEAYSRCFLTKKEDKLAALSGIAKYIHANTSGDTYLACLWRQVLPFQLLWAKHRSRLIRSTPYRAPSWSWASVDGEIRTSRFNGEPLVTLVDAGVTPIGKDSSGQISHAYIRLNEELWKGLKSGYVKREYVNEYQNLDTLEEGDIDVKIDPLFYLPVVGHKYSVNGLVLLRASARGQYIRVGHFKSSLLDADGNDLEPKELFQLMRRFRDLSPLCFEEGTQNTICLV